ncbi:hypothetical protein CPB86DRAFT_826115 [Serendipita vermifera]|nr:hypothetical protein CPB86DRAFT_826115 [Serendipita vermifera]
MSDLFLTFFDALAKGRGRGGSGSSSSGGSDNWDAPGEVKAAMAFYIVFGVAHLVLFCLVVKRLNQLPTWLARGPYIFLCIISFFLFVGYILAGIYTRILEHLNRKVAADTQAFINFLFEVDVAFRPAVVLYVIHVRGAILERSLGKGTFRPAMSQLWKRIFDWIFAIISYIVWMIFVGYNHYIIVHPPQSTVQFNKYNDTRRHIIEAASSVSIVFYVIVIVSSIIMAVQIKSRKLTDSVIKRLLFTIPFFLLFMGERLVTLIFPRVRSSYNTYALNLALIIVQGVARTGIGAVLLLTVMCPIWRDPVSTPSTANANLTEDPKVPFPIPSYMNNQYGWQQPPQQQQQAVYYGGGMPMPYSHAPSTHDAKV